MPSNETSLRFLFSAQSDFFIREAAAHRQVAITCMTYLGFECFDKDFQNSAMDAAILRGDYILHTYAASQWLEHVKQGSQDMSGLPSFGDLCHAFLAFVMVRENVGFDKSLQQKSVVADPSPFRKDWPDVYDWLCRINSYTDAKRKDLFVDDGNFFQYYHIANSLPLSHDI
jgi:hypothetical protein